MEYFFAVLLLLFTPIFLLVGLANPDIYSKVFKRQLSRLKIILITLGLIIISFVGIGLTADFETESGVQSEIVEQQQGEDKGAATTEVESEEDQKEDWEGEQVEGEQVETVLATRVIDGDTIEVEGGKRVRYIGVDTPEVGDCYASEATIKNREIVLNKQVRLEKDVSETDRYGRLLRYVWVGDKMVNEALVQQGYAQVATYPPDVKYQDRFSSTERQARDADLGLWGSTCEVQITPTTQPTQAKETPAAKTSNCSCSGNLYNCGDFSTHNEAQACFESCGGVSNDVHRLDGDSDGVACEGLP